MSRSTILLSLSAATVIAGAVFLEATVGAQTRSRNPLTGAAGSTARPAPAWHNDSWLNADHPLALDELRGRVVMLNFWVFTCYNCTNTVPSLVDFDRKYRDQGLTLVGIHTPEFPPYAGEHDKANLAKALQKYGIEYPNAQDNDNRTWNLYGIRFWPSFVLIDKKGVIRYEGAGEFHLGDATYRLWEGRIRELLAEPYAELEVKTAPAGSDTRVTLLAAPGLKVNARLKPALELKDGTVLRFDSPRLTADSAYFTEPPTAVLAGRHEQLEGTLRASVCDAGGRVCRSVKLQATSCRLQASSYRLPRPSAPACSL